MGNKKYYSVEFKNKFTGKWAPFMLATNGGFFPKSWKKRKDAEAFLKSRKNTDPLRTVKWTKKVSI